MGASSHQDMTWELVKDLQKNISDSTRIEPAYQQLEYSGKTEVAAYFNLKYGESPVQRKPDSLAAVIGVDIVNYVLVLNQDSTKTVRNSFYTRQLELKVVYSHGGMQYTWQGSISDKLNRADLRQLLVDYFPGEVHGDYQTSQPRPVWVVLTTLGVFALMTALFFIRT